MHVIYSSRGYYDIKLLGLSGHKLVSVKEKATYEKTTGYDNENSI